MPQSLIGLKQIKSGEIGGYITGALGVGATGSNSITIYKDLFVTGAANFSGEISFSDVASFAEVSQFNSGAYFSGDVTGFSNFVIDGNFRTSGISSFNDEVFLESDLTVSGSSNFSGSSRFDSTTTFNDTSTFNSGAVFNNGLTVGISTSIFNSDANLLGDNILGSNNGSLTTNYFIGENRFSGVSNISGNINSNGANLFKGVNQFSNDVTFATGTTTFSGASQDFLTTTNLSGYTYINNTGEAYDFIVTNSLVLDSTADFVFSGTGIFLNNIYHTGGTQDIYLPNSKSTYEINSLADFQSGAYLRLLNGAYALVNQSGYFDFRGLDYRTSTSRTYFQSGALVNFLPNSQITGTLNLLSGSSIGIGTSSPTAAIEVIGYDINIEGTGYFDDLRINGYEPITEYRFNAKSYQLNLNEGYKIITYNTTSGTPIIMSNIKATGTYSEINNADMIISSISGQPTSTSATVLFSAAIPENNRYVLDVTISSPTF